MEQINQLLSFTAQAQRAVFEEPLHVPHNRNNYNVDSLTQTSLDHSTALSMKILFYRWGNTDHLRKWSTVSTVFSGLGCPEISGWLDICRVGFLEILSFSCFSLFLGISQKSKTHVSFCWCLTQKYNPHHCSLYLCTSFYFPHLTSIVEGIIQKKKFVSLAWI